jgi:peptidoglycan/LPS O-acetylase OafA/YrhL
MAEQASRDAPAGNPRGTLAGLHGLRFLAACMVLIFHLRNVAGVAPSGNFDKYLGSGVRLFFIISAFSLMYSTRKYIDRADWLRVFAIKRIFRIAPLFYIVLLIDLELGITRSNDWADVVLSASFLFNFLPNLNGSLVWAGWTVGAEMIFYAIFPAILVMMSSWRSALVLLLLSLLVSGASILATQRDGLPLLLSLMTFPSQVQFFAAGIMTYFIYILINARVRVSKNLVLVTIVSVFVVSYFWIPSVDTLRSAWSYELYSLANIAMFSAWVIWQCWRPIPILANRFTTYWGERSYSIYLLHGPVLIFGRPFWQRIASECGPVGGFPIVALLATSVVLCLSWVTYLLVERPGMDFGAWLCRAPTTRGEGAPQATLTGRAGANPDHAVGALQAPRPKPF